jgi:hypothetical protein
VAEGIFEVRRAFPGLRGLGKLAQIGDLGQVKVGQIVDQVCDVGVALQLKPGFALFIYQWFSGI